MSDATKSAEKTHHRPFAVHRVGDRFRMNTAVDTASPQNVPGSSFACSMDRVIPTTVWFRRSMTLFYCGA